MKLTSIFPQIKTDKVQKTREQGETKPASGTTPAAEADRVDLSAGSREVQKMQEILQETPAVRAERVATLKKQIEEGTYQVDPYRVADKMLWSLLSDNVTKE